MPIRGDSVSGTGWTLDAEPTAVPSDRTLSFEDRIWYQQLIEEVYWRHRIWPAKNRDPKPTLEDVLPGAVIRGRVATYLEKSAALEQFWSRPLTGEQLQAEMWRMARQTKNSRLLGELFAALENDPFLIAECLVRPVLVDRLVRSEYARDSRFHGELERQAEDALAAHPDDAVWMSDLGGEYHETEWRLLTEEAETAERGPEQVEGTVIELTAEEWREQVWHLAVALAVNRPLEEVDSPAALLDAIPQQRISRLTEQTERFLVTAVLSAETDRIRTATVVWNKRPFDSWWGEEGGRALESVDDGPVPPPAGGYGAVSPRGDGCVPDRWRLTSGAVPSGRSFHTAVWTGAEMIVWGGAVVGPPTLNTGGRYDPATDSWQATSLDLGVPAVRGGHTAVWTGKEMIVWGGYDLSSSMNRGGRYDPATDRWSPTSTSPGVPAPRYYHTAVWTGSEMIVWGGRETNSYSDTGARYDPVSDSWTPTSTGSGVPSARAVHTAVWTGAEMIVWGGLGALSYSNSGGLYCAPRDSTASTPIE